MYLRANLLGINTDPRRWRLRLPVLGLLRCFLPACLRLSLPVAVTRKRFFDALCVFILGMVAPGFLVSRRGGRPPRFASIKKKRTPGPQPGVRGNCTNSRRRVQGKFAS